MRQVLIADDDRVLSRRIMKAIMRTGTAVVVQEVGSGDEALHFLEKHPVDLVITDIRMQKASGLMVLAFLNAFRPTVPCFVMTAYGTSRLKYKLPPDLLRFYKKPFDVEAMAVAALAVLSRKRGANNCLGIHLPNFIAMAAADRTTATITVSHPEHAPCKLYLKEGEIIDAVSDYSRGEAVAIAAMAWEKPKYSIEFEIPDDLENSIKTPVSHLLRTVCDCFDDVP